MRAFKQAGVFGAPFVYATVTGLRADGTDRVGTLQDGNQVVGRAAVLNTGVAYRRLRVPALAVSTAGITRRPREDG